MRCLYEYFNFNGWKLKRIILAILKRSTTKKRIKRLTVSIPYKGDLSRWKNYRGITLLNAVVKFCKFSNNISKSPCFHYLAESSTCLKHHTANWAKCFQAKKIMRWPHQFIWHNTWAIGWMEVPIIYVVQRFWMRFWQHIKTRNLD